MDKKIFTGFLILVFSALLWLIPINSLVYTFRTDVTTNSFYVSTAVGTDNATVALTKAIYDDDTSTLTILSDLYTDVPVLVSYNTTTRATLFNGLTDNATRTISMSYDTDAVNNSSWDTILDFFPNLWLIFIICFDLAALVAVLVDRIVINRRK